MSIIVVKEGRMVVAIDDLDCEVWNVTFEAKVFNRYGTFDPLPAKVWKI
jgi:hypothetical protein